MSISSNLDQKIATSNQSSNMNKLFKLIHSDILAWSKFLPDNNVNLFKCIYLIFFYCGLRATITYRISHALWISKIPIIPSIFTHINISLYGLDIPPHVPIGPGLYIPHPVGTVITAQAIGANVTLVSGITIGMRNEWAFPTIGNDVFIGAGARILGGISVGDGASIGANAVVVKDVPPGATAVGVPAVVKFPQKTTDA